MAILFCFLNTEVLSEIQKIWVRFKSRTRFFCKKSNRHVSVNSDTAMTFTSRRRSSSNMLLNGSTTTADNKSVSLMRNSPTPTPIDEEYCKLVTETDQTDFITSTEIESFASK